MLGFFYNHIAVIPAHAGIHYLRSRNSTYTRVIPVKPALGRSSRDLSAQIPRSPVLYTFSVV